MQENSSPTQVGAPGFHGEPRWGLRRRVSAGRVCSGIIVLQSHCPIVLLSHSEARPKSRIDDEDEDDDDSETHRPSDPQTHKPITLAG